jgi:penicillin-binding protein 2
MFSRRLRIFMLLIFMGAVLLVARAAVVQIIDRDEWLAAAAAGAERRTFLPAPRGRLLDMNGEVLAQDFEAYDARVDFRAIDRQPDDRWLHQQAESRARRKPGWTDADFDTRQTLVDAEKATLLIDLEDMWDTMARVSNQTRIEIDEIRADIVDRVRRRQESKWTRDFERAMQEFTARPPPGWIERLLGGTRKPPRPEDFHEPIDEQLSRHVILAALNSRAYNELKKATDRYPALSLTPGIARKYPYHDVAAHLLGHLSQVNRGDLDNDTNKDDDLRRYRNGDLIGRDGLERLAETRLRGTRGQLKKDRRGALLDVDQATPGQDVRTSIDIRLQKEIQDAFNQVDFRNPDKDAEGHEIVDELKMNGAAVVIDLKTGQVRAMVSVPTFDNNAWDEVFAQSMRRDDLNRPMQNRALMHAIEPGSTVKPVVGIGATIQKIIGPAGTIECNGFPVINGKPIGKPRCWTESMYPGRARHHAFPSAAPHPTGKLNLSEAIERSCNVYFVELGSKLGIEGLSYWYRQFGLGQVSGVGLPEARGMVPAMARIVPSDRDNESWYASIGQGRVVATPMQIANQMATIARRGVWMRPSLLMQDNPPVTLPDGTTMPEKRDIKGPPELWSAVHRGMIDVVSSDAGTGKQIRRDDVLIAGKTGSATASPLVRLLRDRAGEPQKDADGKIQYEVVPYGTRTAPNFDLPWYRTSGNDDAGKPKGTHGWYAGFAPADDPQVAFAVYVEYGNSGGVSAGSVVRKLVDACIRTGHIRPTGKRPSPPATVDDRELMSD